MWTREVVRGELIKLFEHHAQTAGTVDEKSSIIGDLGIDSLGVMEVVAEIEDRFKLTIPDDLLRDIDTVKDVVTAIETKLRAEGRLEG